MYYVKNIVTNNVTVCGNVHDACKVIGMSYSYVWTKLDIEGSVLNHIFLINRTGINFVAHDDPLEKSNISQRLKITILVEVSNKSKIIVMPSRDLAVKYLRKNLRIINKQIEDGNANTKYRSKKYNVYGYDGFRKAHPDINWKTIGRKLIITNNRLIKASDIYSKKSKLWKLSRVTGVNLENDPWKGSGDMNHSVIVRTYTEREARMEATRVGKGEVLNMANVWKDNKFTSCVELSNEGNDGVVMVNHQLQ